MNHTRKDERKPGESVAIVAGGALDTGFVSSIRAKDVIIGVDRGALWLMGQGIVPHLSLGDFDSVTGAEGEYIRKTSAEFRKFPARKNATDLELAVDAAVQMDPKEVWMYGVLGHRFDHSMAAVHMLQKVVSHNIYGQIVDNFNYIHIVRHLKEKISRIDGYPYVSVIPLETQTVVTLKDFAYDVDTFAFDTYTSRGISNSIPKRSATITVHHGQVLIVHSRD